MRFLIFAIAFDGALVELESVFFVSLRLGCVAKIIGGERMAGLNFKFLGQPWLRFFERSIFPVDVTDSEIAVRQSWIFGESGFVFGNRVLVIGLAFVSRAHQEMQ